MCIRDRALLAKFYQQAAPPKGEIVILVSGMAASDDTFDITKLNAMLREEMQATSLRDAVQTVSQISGKSRKIIYSLAIDLNRENDR